MADEDIRRRVDRLEEEITRLTDTISGLNTSIAVLNKTVENIANEEAARRAFKEKSVLFIVGAFVSAAVAWVIRGGLGT